MSGTAARTSGSEAGGTGLTLFNILTDTINSYARDPKDVLYAALYSFTQSFCTLNATFRRHTMDPRGRIAVSLLRDFEFLETDSVWDAINEKVWHPITHKELIVLLETLGKADKEPHTPPMGMAKLQATRRLRVLAHVQEKRGWRR